VVSKLRWFSLRLERRDWHIRSLQELNHGIFDEVTATCLDCLVVITSEPPTLTVSRLQASRRSPTYTVIYTARFLAPKSFGDVISKGQ
jgi:hypothetical protein